MDVAQAIRERTSCRTYRPDPVCDEHLERILEAVRLAPSACNRQPWRLAVVCDPAARRRIVEKGFLPGLGMGWALDAPVLIVLGLAPSLVTHRLAVLFSRVEYPWIDIGIAGEHLVLAATELGLGTCWIGWIRPRALRRIVGWPSSIRPAAVITVGHPGEAWTPRYAETRRKPLAEFTTRI
jgi:nitroreductase